MAGHVLNHPHCCGSRRFDQKRILEQYIQKSQVGSLCQITFIFIPEWMYSPKPEDEEGPNSHTWKYLREVRKPSNAGYHLDASRLGHSGGERPHSHAKDTRPGSHYDRSKEDGDTDSSFSWQGSSNYLNQKGDEGDKKWI